MARGNQRDKARVSLSTQDIQTPFLNEELILQPGKNPKRSRCAEKEEHCQPSSIPILIYSIKRPLTPASQLS